MIVVRMKTAEATQHKRRAAAEKAKITKQRNNALRRSSVGRLLLVLERCASLVKSGREMDSRRFLRFLRDLRYACRLADETGIAHGWFADESGMFSLAFGLSSGDVVFSTLDESLGTGKFPRSPVTPDNSHIVALAIDRLLGQIRRSA